MFTYKIASPKARPDPKREPFLSKEEILKRNLSKTWLAVGDKVKFKKPRRNPVYGKIVEIVEDPDKTTWAKGGLRPMNIVLDIEKVDHQTGAISTERVKTNVKKLLWVSRSKEHAV